MKTDSIIYEPSYYQLNEYWLNDKPKVYQETIEEVQKNDFLTEYSAYSGNQSSPTDVIYMFGFLVIMFVFFVLKNINKKLA